MKRLAQRTVRLTLTCLFTLSAFAPGAWAQEHQHADSTGMMQHGHMEAQDDGPDMEQMQALMPQMMRMHEHMMADSALHQMMMADPEIRQSMHELMGGDRDMAAMRERMAAMTPAERRAMMHEQHAQMQERMAQMPMAERRTMMQRMMAMHQHMMDNASMRERMMADPEMRRMMEAMRKHMQQHGMMHDEMDRGE